MTIYGHSYYISGPSERIAVGDWICITWMEGQPTAEVIGIGECGWPVVEHPLLPGLGPITVDVYDLVARKNDEALFVGENL